MRELGRKRGGLEAKKKPDRNGCHPKDEVEERRNSTAYRGNHATEHRSGKQKEEKKKTV